MRIAPLLAAALGIAYAESGQTTVEQALPHVAEAAGHFAETAQKFLSHETLRQRVIRRAPGRPQYDTKQIVSYYAFTTLNGSPALREIREIQEQPQEKDSDAGKFIRDVLLGHDDGIKNRLLKAFENEGLNGVATDLGQLVLLFGKSNLKKYVFEYEREETVGYVRTVVMRYSQTAGTESVRITEGGKHTKSALRGWLWVRLPDYLPIRITMIAVRREGKHEIRDEAEVDYTNSPGALLPTAAVHRRYEDDVIAAEDDFQYSNWQPIANR